MPACSKKQGSQVALAQAMMGQGSLAWNMVECKLNQILSDCPEAKDGLVTGFPADLAAASVLAAAAATAFAEVRHAEAEVGWRGLAVSSVSPHRCVNVTEPTVDFAATSLLPAGAALFPPGNVQPPGDSSRLRRSEPRLALTRSPSMHRQRPLKRRLKSLGAAPQSTT